MGTSLPTELIPLNKKGVYPAFLLLILLSWTVQQAACHEKNDAETKKALLCKVQPPGKSESNCRVVACLSRHEPSRPAGWTIPEFIDAYDKICVKYCKLNMGKINC